VLPPCQRLSSAEQLAERGTQKKGALRIVSLSMWNISYWGKQPPGQTKQEPSLQWITMSNDPSRAAFQERLDGSRRIY